MYVVMDNKEIVSVFRYSPAFFNGIFSREDVIGNKIAVDECKPSGTLIIGVKTWSWNKRIVIYISESISSVVQKL